MGLYAIQLAKLAGYRVAATCSPHSNGLVKSYGADEVFDYKASDVVDQIKRTTGGGVVSGIECAGGIKSYELATKAFHDKGGLLTALLLIPDEAHKIRPDVKIERILMYTIGGYVSSALPFVREPADPVDSLSSSRPVSLCQLSQRTRLGSWTLCPRERQFLRSITSRATRSTCGTV